MAVRAAVHVTRFTSHRSAVAWRAAAATPASAPSSTAAATGSAAAGATVRLGLQQVRNGLFPTGNVFEIDAGTGRLFVVGLLGFLSTEADPIFNRLEVGVVPVLGTGTAATAPVAAGGAVAALFRRFFDVVFGQGPPNRPFNPLRPLGPITPIGLFTPIGPLAPVGPFTTVGPLAAAGRLGVPRLAAGLFVGCVARGSLTPGEFTSPLIAVASRLTAGLTFASPFSA
jgi:hypothetical protein